ncbi:hypothetical protein H6P81_013547 [Aristolochia fimbriata]|uniref:Uncharacterized protein n=1 Tax=Aristolochia fimbriata TaxID=158543 RepID=A0AAV7EFH7_ARIFI|nr:hypothetical protein H6P81_013547 [Aristolochia fimbriata]
MNPAILNEKRCARPSIPGSKRQTMPLSKVSFQVPASVEETGTLVELNPSTAQRSAIGIISSLLTGGEGDGWRCKMEAISIPEPGTKARLWPQLQDSEGTGMVFSLIPFPLYFLGNQYWHEIKEESIGPHIVSHPVWLSSEFSKSESLRNADDSPLSPSELPRPCDHCGIISNSIPRFFSSMFLAMRRRGGCRLVKRKIQTKFEIQAAESGGSEVPLYEEFPRTPARCEPKDPASPSGLRSWDPACGCRSISDHLVKETGTNAAIAYSLPSSSHLLRRRQTEQIGGVKMWKWKSLSHPDRSSSTPKNFYRGNLVAATESRPRCLVASLFWNGTVHVSQYSPLGVRIYERCHRGFFPGEGKDAEGEVELERGDGRVAVDSDSAALMAMKRLWSSPRKAATVVMAIDSVSRFLFSQCSDHPYRNNPGGICAFCLQEKLGKLVSSSKSNPFYPIVAAAAAPSSSSSSPSFRSEGAGVGGLAAPVNTHRARMVPFLAHKQKKVMSATSVSVPHADDPGSLVLKRSRSVAVPRHFSYAGDDSPRKKSFWSFLHLSRRRMARERETNLKEKPAGATGDGGAGYAASAKGGETVRRDLAGGAEEGTESPNSSQASSSFGRKVARSRSVGCGSRSFSGDFLERISTGFGDCTLRRVESQRESKPKIVLHRVAAEERIKERVKCGGIFGGFGMISSSSSYWLSDDFNGRISGPHGRSKSWTWAFASPMRAFRPSKPSSYIADKDADGRAAPTAGPNIDASPSLLATYFLLRASLHHRLGTSRYGQKPEISDYGRRHYYQFQGFSLQKDKKCDGDNRFQRRPLFIFLTLPHNPLLGRKSIPLYQKQREKESYKGLGRPDQDLQEGAWHGLDRGTRREIGWFKSGGENMDEGQLWSKDVHDDVAQVGGLGRGRGMGGFGM